jgi:GH25 family lysozyme M1 (1,4-beta-N-acetylmuramidase)
VTWLRRRHGIAGPILIIVVVVGLALAAAVQTASRGSTALAAVTPVQGADVSSIQGSSINWTNVQHGSERFVAVKATEGNYYPTTPLPYYQDDVTGAVAAGLYVMPYVFANPYGSSASNVNAGNGWGSVQADFGWKTIGAATPAYKSSALMLPVAVDLENDPYASSETNSNACYGLSPSTMVAWITAFINEMKKDSGKTPIIYTTTGWWNSCTGDSTLFKADPLWIASYGVSVPSIPSAWSNLTFWQYSDSGTVPGIGGPVDLDSLGPTQISTINTAIPAEQIQTLSSLQAQANPSGYTATGLPPGVSMSTSGLITGTPTALGQYSVTVTPPAGAAPASMAFTWTVRGAIAIANATSRSSTVGTPAWFRITTSGPDQNAGYAPTLHVTGLPTGVSMDSAGVITGWPTRWGAFKVTVTASDALGGTGTASFTWNVTAASTAGIAGQVKQNGGSGKCLNDPSSTSANGTLINLSTCTGASPQRWTLVQDGTLRVGGKCLQVVGNGTANGTKVELEPCNSDDGSQVWQASTDGQILNQQSGKCLDVAVTSAVNGTQPVIWTCANLASQPNEHWLRPAALLTSGEPGKCVGTSGTAAVLATCSTTTWQHWQPQANGTVSVNGWCLTEGGTAAGSKLSLLAAASCANATTDKWKLVPDGLIATELVNTASGLCAADPATGTQLVIEPCANTATSTWRLQ